MAEEEKKAPQAEAVVAAPAKETKETKEEKTGGRPQTCFQCKKRLSRKQWYYRNGAYFCKKRCWVTEREKAVQTASKQEAVKDAKISS